MEKIKIYLMPDGVKRQYREGTQPKGAVLYEPEKPKAEKPKKQEKAGK